MNPLAATLRLAPPHPLLARTGAAVREAFCITSGRCVLDRVREPDGLQYPPNERTRRLMRNARVSAW